MPVDLRTRRSRTMSKEPTQSTDTVVDWTDSGGERFSSGAPQLRMLGFSFSPVVQLLSLRHTALDVTSQDEDYEWNVRALVEF